MTIMEFQAKKIERIAQSLAHFVSTTAEELLGWNASVKPESDTRSVYEQVSECVRVNLYVAALLRGETPDAYAVKDESPIPFEGSADAQSQLVESGQVLAAAVRSLSDQSLEEEFPHWRGPIKGEVIIEMPYRNMAYHAGQVNYIQTLAGDAVFHLPPTWL